MRKSTSIFFVLAFLTTACAGVEDRPLPPSHPARHEAPAAPLPAASATLDVAQADPLPVAEPETPADHDANQSTSAAHPSHRAHQAQPAYACPMHPHITSDEPGRCPECGMRLEPVAKEERP